MKGSWCYFNKECLLAKLRLAWLVYMRPRQPKEMEKQLVPLPPDMEMQEPLLNLRAGQI